MIIGIDFTGAQGNTAGDGTYWRGLAGGLASLVTKDQIILYLNKTQPYLQVPIHDRLRVKVLSPPFGRFWRLWSLSNELRRDRPSLIHITDSIPWMPPCPIVASIHDISFERSPDWFPPSDTKYYRHRVRAVANRAVRIFACSEYTRQDLLEFYRLPPEKVDVVYPGVDDRFRPLDRDFAKRVLRERYGIEAPFVLAVGTIQPRKNLPRLLDAFAILMRSLGFDCKLVLVGKFGWMESGLPDKASQLGISQDLILTGYVSDDDVPIFYNAAETLVYPSLFEGFGLPPLEAMACGTPVITANRTSLPEVVGDAGIMVDPYDTDALADAMSRVLSDESLRAEMSAQGLKQAKEFDWERAAQKALSIYREVCRMAGTH